MNAWWFEPPDGRLGYGDKRKPEKGVTHTVDCEPVLCEAGLHGSERLLDALQYAKSSVVWRVKLSGTIVHGGDKLSATERTYLERYEIDDILREFARWCALQVIDKWDAPDVVRRFLETGDKSLRAAAWAGARDAAWYARGAALDAAWAAWDAAASAAWYAAHNAAHNAAEVAARVAARVAAGNAAWAAGDAAWDEYNVKLENMVKER